MPYSQVKVYSDGSHYIGIPYIPDPRAKTTGRAMRKSSKSKNRPRKPPRPKKIPL